MTSAWKEMPQARVAEALGAIRNRLLNFLLDLKEQYPAMDTDGDLKSIPGDDLALEFRTLAGASNVDFHHCRWRECLDKAPRAIELARSVDDPHGELLTHWSAAVAEIATGHLDAARRHVAAGMTMAEKLRDSFWLSGSLLRSEFVSRIEGDWQMAQETTDRGLALLPLETRLLSVRVLSPPGGLAERVA